MLGPEGAALVLQDVIAEHLPDKVDQVERRLNAVQRPRVAREALHPKLVAAFDVMSLATDAYPAVLVVASRLTGMARVDVDAELAAYAGQAVYACTYSLRLFIWARGRVGHDPAGMVGQEADTNLKRLVLALREVLLDHLELVVTINDETVAGTLDPGSITEEYAGVTEDKGGTVAASYTDVAITLLEAVPLAVDAPDVDDVSVAVHPALG